MSMKKILITGVFGLVCFSACEKAVEQVYTSPDNIYFDFNDPENENVRIDSIGYSFALYPEKGTDTVYLPVRITGMRKSMDRAFRITVIDSSTTAVAGVHYKALEPEYIMPADSGQVKVPVILYGTDALLLEQSVRIKFRLASTADFAVTNHSYDTAKVIFSNRLEQPVWWNVWAGELGAYSRVKHELFIRTSGTTEMPATPSGEVVPMALFYSRTFRSFLNDPFAWVAANPGKGYTIAQDGTGKYEFFSITNPDKAYPLELNPADNKYYFMDENGNRII